MTRLCTFVGGTETRVGILVDGMIADLNLATQLVFPAEKERQWPTMLDFLSSGPAGLNAAREIEAYLAERKAKISGCHGEQVTFSEEEVTLLAPVPNPPKILCLAGNYMEHVQEGRQGKDAPRPEDIHVFTKFAGNAVIGHEAPIVAANSIEKLDYELELGLIIGKQGRYIPVEKALDHLGGLTVFNDISDRGYMPTSERPIHWFAMKSTDNSGPMGPCLLLMDGKLDANDLDMKLWVNGELRQDSRTSRMVFSAAQVLSRLSDLVTLQVGDVIATGTPAGNGWSRQIFLQDGDVIEAQIEGIGLLRNRVVFEEPVYRTG